MKRVFSAIVAASGIALFAADIAAAQSLGGFPIREPGAGVQNGVKKDKKDKKGPMQIIVDANGPGPYTSVAKAVKDVAEGGVVYVMHGVYNESITLNKSVFIQGDRGPGSGVEINAPIGEPCLAFAPKEATDHAVVANVTFAAKINSGANACVDVQRGVFTLKESNVIGSTSRPAVLVGGGTVTLKKNKITGGSEGVYVEQVHSLMNTAIIDNKIVRNKIGIDISSGSRADVVIAGNEIYNNLDSGVKSSGYGEAALIGNKIRNNKGIGVILDKFSKLSLVRYNEIVQNSRDGIAIPYGVNGIIEDNEIVGNDRKAISLHKGGIEPIITNNKIVNNGDDGKKRRSSKRRRSKQERNDSDDRWRDINDDIGGRRDYDDFYDDRFDRN
ncbi:MAG: right-handed parallel beta-helix repeat-containing protein [Pseudomonadota bacterium]